ncbi:MAG: MalY/PatB family protein [Clostridia bacterium]|nr:MalY/PatB family protein [Clostridia bacterium]
MKYDFESLIDRNNTGSFKWNAMRKISPNAGGDIVPLSVADMEFYNPPELIEGLCDYLKSSVLGYTGPTDAYFDAVIAWMERRHHFLPRREWILQSPGVVPALHDIVNALTEPGDGVIVFTPVYYPFFSAVEQNGRTLLRSPLIRNGLRYEMDFDDFERKACAPGAKMCIICSPHNPVGRIWTRDELERLSGLCLDNGLILVSDEIHNDLILPGNRHVSAGTLSPEYLGNLVLCTAPSKTFNLAGMQTSNIIVPSAPLREKLNAAGGYFSLNALGYKACELAYNRCEPWLEELLEVLDSNRQLVESYMQSNHPEITVYPLQGTYLQWWDMRKLGLPYREMEKFLIEKAQLFTDEGSLFGEEGNGFVRVNLACPASVLNSALHRLTAAILELRNQQA